jgi:hypothetical protein
MLFSKLNFISIFHAKKYNYFAQKKSEHEHKTMLGEYWPRKSGNNNKHMTMTQNYTYIFDA